jgi:hypothetical protein
MTETKTSVYDQGHEEDEAPLVQAHPAPVDILSLDATIIDDEDQDASSLPSDPTMHEYDDDIPLFPTEEELRKEETVVGAGVASGVFGLYVLFDDDATQYLEQPYRDSSPSILFSVLLQTVRRTALRLVAGPRGGLCL